jgi:cytochrome c peroxidase
MKPRSGLALVCALVLGWSATEAGVAAEPARRHIRTDPGARLADLGREIFFDATLSLDGSIACASCHVPDRAFSDGRAVSIGVGGGRGTRNAPSLVNVGSARTLFWDGRREVLEDQVLEPLLSAVEHGLPSEQALVVKVRARPSYLALFAQALGSGEPTAPGIGRALAAFLRTLRSGDAPIDRFLAGEEEALSASARRGLRLFTGYAGCSECHRMDGPMPLFTDHAFHSLGIGMEAVRGRLTDAAKRAYALDDPIRGELILADPDVAALGRFVVTKQVADIGKFKTPSLRNVALTGPYMHEGSIATLSEAIDRELYYRSLAIGRPLALTRDERADLRAFLESLTDPQFLTAGRPGLAEQRCAPLSRRPRAPPLPPASCSRAAARAAAAGEPSRRP